MAESITDMRNAVIVESKGADPYAVAEVKKFLLENGFITSILQSDGEPAIKSLQEKHLRLLRLQMSEQYGVSINDIKPNHPVFIWTVKHCAFLRNCYQIGQDGKSPYERTRGQKYKSAIIAFGKTVLLQHQEPKNQKVPKRLQPQWSFGIWVGRDSTTGCHVTPTTEGAIRATSGKRLVEKVHHQIRLAVRWRCKMASSVCQYSWTSMSLEDGKSQITREEIIPHPEDNIQAEPQDHSATAAPSTMSTAGQQQDESMTDEHLQSSSMFIELHSSCTFLHSNRAH
eukprot:2752827-Amphidinium_carterae.5